MRQSRLLGVPLWSLLITVTPTKCFELIATAASIWNTGAIGVSVAYSYYEIAITLSLINFLVLQFGGVIKQETKAVSQKHSDDEAGKPARSLNESD